MKGISKETTSAGLNRYVVGSFNDYKSAEALKAEMIRNGLTDAFVIAFFNGEYISKLSYDKPGFPAKLHFEIIIF